MGGLRKRIMPKQVAHREDTGERILRMVESPIEIVEATKFDISELLRLGWNGYKEMEFLAEGIEYDTSAVSKLYLSIMDKPELGVIYAAKHPKIEKKLVGRIVAVVSPFLHNPSHNCIYVIGVFVDKKFRGQKIGGELMERVKQWAVKRDIKIYVVHHRTKSGPKIRENLERDDFKPLETLYYKVIK